MKLIDKRTMYGKPDRGPVVNVKKPVRYTDDFLADNGYFTEEDGTKLWKIENSQLSVSADENGALTYIHVFEKNVTFAARIKYSNVEDNLDSRLSFLLRYNSPEAYVKVSYVPKINAWCMYSSNGIDFPIIKHKEVRGFPAVENVWIDVKITIDDLDAKLIVDGKEVFTYHGIDHTSPGRIGFLAERISMDVDNVDISLLSGQGVIWRNVVHHKLPDDKYREGGSVYEMSDNSLIYVGDCGFTSADNGTTWQHTNKAFANVGKYPNIMRLASGDLIRIAYAREDDKRYIYSETSSDDGETWVRGGKICDSPYSSELGPTKAGAGNMNDKIMQFKSGRIYYSQNFDAYASKEMAYGKYWVFCVFYYSDDNGKTWHEAKSKSWDITGDIERFGECKVLECADGTIRMYNSWNYFGCVVCAESYDQGETWGHYFEIPELPCASSSMQFVKDIYADNDTTYYMVWVHGKPRDGIKDGNTPRSRLAMAKTTDGKNWKYVGDVWRWESEYAFGGDICHIVDPFIQVTKDYVICGSGFSEHICRPECGDNYSHHAQRQHIYSIRKDTLPESDVFSPAQE